jgi:hypothetical protein
VGADPIRPALTTFDAGVIDQDGYVSVTTRADDVINASNRLMRATTGDDRYRPSQWLAASAACAQCDNA